MEKVDIFTANFEKIGVEERAKVYELGLWHQAFHCWVFNSKGQIVFQLRSKNKSVFPSLLDVSAGGAMMAGESLEDGVREVEEELGLRTKFADLHYLGVQINVCDIVDSYGKINFDRIFDHTFLFLDETRLIDYELQKSELDGIFQIDINQAFSLFSNEVENIDINGFVLDEKNNLVERKMNINISNFCPWSKSYYIKCLIMIERYLEGKKHLAI